MRWSKEQIDDLYERSKYDNEIIVGSEIRAAISSLEQRNAELEQRLTEALKEEEDCPYYPQVNKLKRQLGEMREALQNLVEAVDKCQPHIDSAFIFAAVHGQNYSGPTYGKELDAAVAALSAIGDAPKEEA